MNYYQHHIGDYRRDTTHLSLLEHGVYRQLIDLYCLNEEPIPADTVVRKVCARTDEELAALDIVLNEFFTLEDGVWTHKRCEAEIQNYHGKADKARSNGQRGGRPKKTKVVSENNPEITGSVIFDNPEITQTKANHKPITINHKPNTPLTPQGGEDAVGQPEDKQPAKPKRVPKPPRPTNVETTDPDDKPDEPAKPVVNIPFDEFWAAWPSSPRKVGKASAEEKWRRSKFSSIGDQIIAHVNKMKQHDQWQRGFEPAPLTYLNQRRWEDGVPGEASDSHDPFAGAM